MQRATVKHVQRGTPPRIDPSAVFGITSLELD